MLPICYSGSIFEYMYILFFIHASLDLYHFTFFDFSLLALHRSKVSVMVVVVVVVREVSHCMDFSFNNNYYFYSQIFP